MADINVTVSTTTQETVVLPTPTNQIVEVASVITTTQDTSQYVYKNETGIFITTGQSGQFASSGHIHPETGQFVTTGQTGSFGNSSHTHPETGAMITTGQTGNFVTTNQTGQFSSINHIHSETGTFISTGITGQFAGSGHTHSETGNFALSSHVHSETGQFVTTGQTGSFGTSEHTHPETGAMVTTGQTGQFADVNHIHPNTGVFITVNQTGQFVGTGTTGNFASTIHLHPETGNFSLSTHIHTETGQMVLTTQTGSFATTGYVLTTSGALDQKLTQTGQNLINLINLSSSGVTTLNELAGGITLVGAGNVSISTGNQTITISGSGGMGDTSSFVTTGQTGSFITTEVTGQFARSEHIHSETGNFSLTSHTHPETGTLATTGYVNNISGILGTRIENTGSYLETMIQANSAGVGSINLKSGSLTFTGAGDVVISINGSIFTFSGSGTNIDSGSFVTTGQTGQFANSIHFHSQYSQTGHTHPETGDFALTTHTHTETGQFALTGHIHSETGNFSLNTHSHSETGQMVLTEQTGQFVGTGITGIYFASYGHLHPETGNFALANHIHNETGNMVTTSMTGQFANSGHTHSQYALTTHTHSETGNLTTTEYVNDISGVLDAKIQNSSAGVTSIELLTGTIDLVAAGSIAITTGIGTITISGTPSAPTQHEHNYVTGISINGGTNLTGVVDFRSAGSLTIVSNGNIITYSGEPIIPTSGQQYSNSIYIEQPTASENIAWCYNNDPIVLTKAISVCHGSGANLNWAIYQTTGRHVTGGLVVSGYTNSLTSGNIITTGEFNSALLSGGTFLLLTTSATGGTTLSDFSMTLIGEPALQVFSGDIFQSEIDQLNQRLIDSGAYLFDQIETNNAGVSSLNGQSGILTLVQAGNVFITTGVGTITISGSGGMGDTSSFVTTGQTGQFATATHIHSETGNLALSNHLHSETGNFSLTTHIHTETGIMITTGQTGQFSNVNHIHTETGQFVRNSQTGNFVSFIAGNPNKISGYSIETPVGGSVTATYISAGSSITKNGVNVATTDDLSSYAPLVHQHFQTGDLVKKTETGQFAPSGHIHIETGNFSLTSHIHPQTGWMVSRVAGLTGLVTITGTGNVFVTTNANTITISGSGGQTDLSNYVQKSETGNFINNGMTGTFADINHLHPNTGNFLTTSQTGTFADVSHIHLETGTMVTTSMTGQFVGDSETGNFVLSTNALGIKVFTTSGDARPVGYSKILWVGTGTPNNATEYDLLVDLT